MGHGLGTVFSSNARRLNMLSVAALVMASSMVVGQTPKAEIPKEVLKSFEFYIGEWTGEWKKGDATGTMTMSVKWAPGNHCTIAHYEFTSPDGVLHGLLVSGWNPEKKRVVDTAYESNGSAGEDQWTITSTTVEDGVSKGIKPDGTVNTGKCRIEKKGPDEYTYTKFEGTEGGVKVPDFVGKFRRVSQKPK
jgi:hypothetical protein